MEKLIKNISLREVLNLKDLVQYSEGTVQSRTLVQRPELGMTLFSFDQGEGISTHSAPGDALVYVYEGKAAIKIGEDENKIVQEGQIIVMPANIPHALEAVEKFKMLLIVVKP
ncbi:MAG: cupin domain-containing protein [Bacillota bacterium]|jgi:quercetin dioxygenase-like cupin family protein